MIDLKLNSSKTSSLGPLSRVFTSCPISVNVSPLSPWQRFKTSEPLFPLLLPTYPGTQFCSAPCIQYLALCLPLELVQISIKWINPVLKTWRSHVYSFLNSHPPNQLQSLMNSTSRYKSQLKCLSEKSKRCHPSPHKCQIHLPQASSPFCNHFPLPKPPQKAFNCQSESPSPNSTLASGFHVSSTSTSSYLSSLVSPTCCQDHEENTE